ncbi:MAG TPA: tetratricopeptide repeat protein [Pyrinomonadaceae bacterium]|nr:tetratricopeptide repeat protein [Pyrinomonadaceae bacterium]
MKIKNYFPAAAFVLLVLGFANLNVFAKDEWLRVRSKNFNLIGNASEKDIRKTATKLEQFREVFRQVLSKANFNSPIPTTVIVFKNEAAFTPFKSVKADGRIDKWVAGYFQPGEDVNYITLSAEGVRNDSFGLIFHEYTHFIVDNNFGRSNVPPWFNEGLAEYYQTFQIEGDREVKLGALQNSHLLQLQENKLIPFDTFFGIDNHSLHEQSDDGVGMFYAQAWALMHYLIHGNGGARQKQMYKFLDLVMKNKTPKEAFAEAFQTDYAAMEKELKSYVAKNSYTITGLTFKEKLTFDTEMQTAPLSEAESRAYLGDLLYHGERFKEAEALLQQSLALDANSSQAQMTMGLVKMKQKNFDEARKYLEKSVRADAKNYLAYYNYAYVLSREGMDNGGFVLRYSVETAGKMRESLKKSIELNPKFAESYNLYAFISVVQNEEIEQGIDYLRRALTIAPGNQWYSVRLAELYMRKQDFAAGRKLSQKVFETAADNELKNYAQNTVKSIDSFEQQLAEYKKSGGAPVVTTFQTFNTESEKPLTEEEIGKLREKIKLESLNAVLRKLEAGEKRALGFLTKIECGAKGIRYTFKADNQILTFSSKDFNSLTLISYEEKMNDSQVGCGELKKESFAVVTYRPKANSADKTAGEIVAIEFMPAGFKFLN